LHTHPPYPPTGLRHLSSLTLHADWLHFDSTGDTAQFGDGQRITKPGCGLHSLLAQCLPQLTALTRLMVDEVADTAILKHAPPQLVELASVACDDQSKRWVADVERGRAGQWCGCCANVC